MIVRNRGKREQNRKRGGGRREGGPSHLFPLLWGEQEVARVKHNLVKLLFPRGKGWHLMCTHTRTHTHTHKHTRTHTHNYIETYSGTFTVGKGLCSKCFGACVCWVVCMCFTPLSSSISLKCVMRSSNGRTVGWEEGPSPFWSPVSSSPSAHAQGSSSLQVHRFSTVKL